MSTLNDLPTPALVLDLQRLEANVTQMAAKTARLGVSLRPHVKTHKCVEIGRLQLEQGARGITVSTLEEARVFADQGFADITWAFPVILNRMEEAREIAERVTLRLLVDSVEAVVALEETAFPFHVWLKVDCGYHRAGVDPAGEAAIELARWLHQSPSLRFDGLLTHSGHAYHPAPSRGIREIAEQERKVMVLLAQRLRLQEIEVPRLSVGSTPAISQVESLDGIDEARPGNYVFYDYMQCELGSCSPADCALTVLSSVVSSQPEAGHSVVDAGALTLSKDTGANGAGAPTMGEVFRDYATGRLEPDTRLRSLSQEHGILTMPLPVGTRVRILPNHSCLAAACFDEYAVVRGDRVIDRWKIWRGR
jgi:D-serine deaminase-like pyridoxal phosphate-dependent protein